MKCTGAEWDYCREEKRGCKGCHYDENTCNHEHCDNKNCERKED